MTIEFICAGKTYVCVVGPLHSEPPDELSIAFRPCAFKAPVMLRLAHLGHDMTRGVELYRPIGLDAPAED
jgi:hypothetical protein